MAKKNIKDTFKRVYSSVKWTLKLFWRVSPTLTLLTIVSTIFIEIATILNSFIFARGLDTLLSVSQGESELSALYIIVFLFFAIAVIQQGLGIFSNHVQRLLGSYFYPKFAEFTYKKLSRLSVETLEDPEVNNLIDRAQRESNTIERQFYDIVYLFGILSTVLASGFILLRFAPHFVVVFIVTLVPSLLVDRKYLSKLWKYHRDLVEDQRKAYASVDNLVDSKALQELRITGGYKYLSHHFEKFISDWFSGWRMIRVKWFRYMFSFRVVRSAVEAYADLYIFFKFIENRISIGDVTFNIRQVQNFISSLGQLGNSINNIYEGSLTVNEMIEFFDRPEEEDGNTSIEKLIEGPAISIKDVSFSYPGSKRKIYESLNLEIKSGEKIAIVGNNGAGKTTLIKLILRFYKPQKGEIFINGQNLNDLKINDYYQNVSALFQEYNMYSNLTLEENITLGKQKRKHSKKEIKKAAEYADVSDFVGDFENGYKQILSERYKGGIRPSTGQWQKIAIARFFYRNSPLVIFDEPTAAIDAKSEAKIFNKIYSFFKNKTVIIISHRFSTVRNADRIIVIFKGRIIEQGSHDELMKLDGTYAEAFKLQAEGYKTN